ncbi:hypothetical protein RxyAA322_24660 [Rubrobacter xylanophilus]|uniref:Uncharacterized protein n=1 Tax=Rubrobacter xylanophilus TaxID=49319 RepID=A0A510HKX0_9ACTN|nr:hypothetical protein [Rubrobacter xylanophilus]BBL80612.1 hypothetical protein RxyAA322_24660 [Rubrobacter xylanophilus]
MPEAASGTLAVAVEARMAGGIYALNRFLMTLQGKRMPIGGLTVGMGPEESVVVALFECEPESARRYMALLSSLEDVREVREAGEVLEVALAATGEGWREAAVRAGVVAHKDGGTVVASGEPGPVEEWLRMLGEGVEDAIRLGPVARPGRGR